VRDLRGVLLRGLLQGDCVEIRLDRVSMGGAEVLAFRQEDLLRKSSRNPARSPTPGMAHPDSTACRMRATGVNPFTQLMTDSLSHPSTRHRGKMKPSSGQWVTLRGGPLGISAQYAGVARYGTCFVSTGPSSRPPDGGWEASILPPCLVSPGLRIARRRVHRSSPPEMIGTKQRSTSRAPIGRRWWSRRRDISMRDIPLLAKVTILLCVAKLATVLLPFATLQRVVNRLATPRSAIPANADEGRARFIWAARAMGWRLFGNKPCLPQALVVHTYLRRLGYDGQLHIGVTLHEGNLLAHAWVMEAGRVVIGGGDSPSKYSPLYTLG
jgi:hypothetical protein